MFGAKYNRLKFWIISIVLLIPTSIFNTMAKALEKAGKDDVSVFFYLLVFLLSLIWINTLANRIRDYGSNPWYSLWSLIPLVNIGMALYYGIVQYKKNEDIQNNNVSNKSSLTKAVINHTKDIACDIKPKVNEYIEKHSQQDCSNINENLEINEDEIYEKVMIEIEENKKVKSAWAKAFAQSQGDENKAKALYINLRVEELKKSMIKKIGISSIEEKTINNKQENEIDKLLIKQKSTKLTAFEKARLEYLIDYKKRNP